MRLIVENKQLLLAENVKVAGTFCSRFLGWMGKKEIQDGEALIIEPCNSIHTFFMKTDIDVLFLDKDNYIIHMHERMKPNRISKFIALSVRVIELKSGAVNDLRIKIGDKIIKNQQNAII